MADVLSTLTENIQNTTWLEAVAVLFGLLSVWYSRKQNILVFPTGIISVCIYIYLTLQYKLYADTGINAFYFVMSVYGWYNWTHQSGKKKEREVTKTTKVEKIISLVGIVVFFFVIRYALINFTDSNVPNIDALTTSIFLVGMWLMALKKIANWTLWIIGDLISIPLYAYKGLVLTSFQFTVFLVLAVMGYIAWTKSYNSRQNA